MSRSTKSDAPSLSALIRDMDAVERKLAEVLRRADVLRSERKELRGRVQEYLRNRDREFAGTMAELASSQSSTEAPSLPRDEKADGNWTPDRVRRIQAILGLDNEEFARAMNVSTATIHNWRTGTTPPSERYWSDLAKLDAQSKRVAS